MRYSQIQSIADFNAYLQGCSVDNNRIGQEGKSHHSTHSLKSKLQHLIKSEPFFSPMYIAKMNDGKVMIAVGLSDQDKLEIVVRVNRLIQSVALLESLEKAANDSKPKGLKSKFDRLLTRVALNIRYGSQPKCSKLLGRVRHLVTQRLNEEIKLTNKSLQLPALVKAILCNTLTNFKDQLYSSLSENKIIELPSLNNSVQEPLLDITAPTNPEMSEEETSDTATITISELEVPVELPKDRPASKKHTERRVVSQMLRKATLKPVEETNQRKSEKRSSIEKSLLRSLTNRRVQIKDSSPETSPSGETNWLEDN